MAPNAAEVISSLGESGRLVAVSKFCISPSIPPALPRVGGLFNPDLEFILRLKPDLLILRGSSPALERLCRENNIRIYHDLTTNIEEIYTTIAQLGVILDKKNAADTLIRHMKERINAIRSAFSGRRRPRVLITIARQADSLSRITTTGGGTFVDQMITLAGGDNIFGTSQAAYPEVSLEDILTARPDVIIEAMPERGTMSESFRRRVVGQWQRLGPLPATKHDRVYLLTDDHFLIPSPRVVDSIAHLARLLYPEVAFD